MSNGYTSLLPALSSSWPRSSICQYIPYIYSCWGQRARLLTHYSSPIPEITDADMAFQAEETHAGTDVGPFWKQYRLFHAAWAQFCYTGAQVAIAGYFINYVRVIFLNSLIMALTSGRSSKLARTLLHRWAPNFWRALKARLPLVVLLAPQS